MRTKTNFLDNLDVSKFSGWQKYLPYCFLLWKIDYYTILKRFQKSGMKTFFYTQLICSSFGNCKLIKLYVLCRFMFFDIGLFFLQTILF